MIIPTSREDWESLTADELATYSDQQLKNALKEHFGLKSHIYFMPVAKKVEYIMSPDSRPTLQAEAEVRQKGHQDAGAAHRGKLLVTELIAERSEDRVYTFQGVQRYPEGFVDPFSDRLGRVAYVIKDEVDGALFPTQKATAKRLTELERLTGFDERISVKKQKPAHKAGLTTLEDVIAKGDPEAKEAVESLTKTEGGGSSLEGDVDTAPIDSNRGSALDDILNNIPQ